VFRLFRDVKIDFDFHARDIDTGDAIICSEKIVPSPKFSDVKKISFSTLIENPRETLSTLSKYKEHEITIYLNFKDYLYFLSIYLKSTLEVDDEFVLQIYRDSLVRLDELDNTLLKPSPNFKNGIEEALKIKGDDALSIIKSAPQVNYIDSYENLPMEILLAHWFATGGVLGDLPNAVYELPEIHLITLHDAMVMGGLITDELKPYANLDQYKRQEMCEPQDCRCASSKKIYQSKVGNKEIWVVDYAKRENNPW
jgi:hypothetical protein